MNLYSIRKFLYATGGLLLAEVLIALGSHLIQLPTESWTLRGVMYVVCTTVVAKLRERFLPGFLGAPK